MSPSSTRDRSLKAIRGRAARRGELTPSWRNPRKITVLARPCRTPIWQRLGTGEQLDIRWPAVSPSRDFVRDGANPLSMEAFLFPRSCRRSSRHGRAGPQQASRLWSSDRDDRWSRRIDRTTAPYRGSPHRAGARTRRPCCAIRAPRPGPCSCDDDDDKAVNKRMRVASAWRLVCGGSAGTHIKGSCRGF